MYGIRGGIGDALRVGVLEISLVVSLWRSTGKKRLAASSVNVEDRSSTGAAVGARMGDWKGDPRARG